MASIQELLNSEEPLVLDDVYDIRNAAADGDVQIEQWLRDRSVLRSRAIDVDPTVAKLSAIVLGIMMAIERAK